MIELEECNIALTLAIGGSSSTGDLDPSKKSDEIDEETSTVQVETSIGSGKGGGKRKKLRLSKEQLSLLEDSFREHPTLAPVCASVAPMVFRTKLKQTETDCEFLKKCHERLVNENRRLKREMMELRSAAKPGSGFFVELRKAARLRRCSSCEEKRTVS
ncbi:hypothetical protein Cni_G17312 [Canna indica]|uniref:Leucine zipper homeobox-associated domain-containing protein n=1 Tax=Canna indica TaxID=4628 RepID=A0AAQ3KGQ2_9LILI|nr:hypothetical protein Cni_G17312 [Canna indica]